MQDDEIMVSDVENDDADSSDDDEGSNGEDSMDGGERQRRHAKHKRGRDVVKKTAVAASSAGNTSGLASFSPPFAVGVCMDAALIQTAAEEEAKRGTVATAASVADQKLKTAEARKASREVLVVAVSVNAGPYFAGLHKLKCVVTASAVICGDPGSNGDSRSTPRDEEGLAGAIAPLKGCLIGGMMSCSDIAAGIAKAGQRPVLGRPAGTGSAANAKTNTSSTKKPVRVAIKKEVVVLANATSKTAATTSSGVVDVSGAAAAAAVATQLPAIEGSAVLPGTREEAPTSSSAVPAQVDAASASASTATTTTTEEVVVTLSPTDKPITDRPTLESIEATIRKAGGRTSDWVADEVHEFHDVVSKARINVALKVMGKRELGQNGAKASWTVLVTAQQYLDMNLEQYATALTAHKDKQKKRKRERKAKKAKEGAAAAAVAAVSHQTVLVANTSGSDAQSQGVLRSDKVVVGPALTVAGNGAGVVAADGKIDGDRAQKRLKACVDVVPGGGEEIASMVGKKRAICVATGSAESSDTAAAGAPSSDQPEGDKPTSKKARATIDPATASIAAPAAAAKPIASYFKPAAK
jgi:hypothetical protein